MFPPKFSVLCAVHVVSKESKWLVFPRTFYLCYQITLLSSYVFVYPDLIYEAYEVVFLSVSPLSLLVNRQSVSPQLFFVLYAVLVIP
jgi:hypothetical protein